MKPQQAVHSDNEQWLFAAAMAGPHHLAVNPRFLNFQASSQFVACEDIAGSRTKGKAEGFTMIQSP